MGMVGSICYDHLNNAIWVGTSINIYVYDLKTQTLTEPFKGMNLGGIEGCTGYYIDKDNHLWLGLTEGLCRIDLSSLKTPRLIYQLEDQARRTGVKVKGKGNLHHPV